MSPPRKPYASGASSKRRGNAVHSHHTPPKAQTGQNARAVWLAFVLAGIGYLMLSSQQPAGWGVPLWLALALLLIPAIGGLAINRLQAAGRPVRQAFFAGMKGVGWAMFFYASITLTVLANRVGGAGNGGQEFLAGLLTVVACTLFAGSVAGCVNVLLIGLIPRRSENGPAS